MLAASVDALVQRLRESRLCSPEQLDELQRFLLPRCTSPSSLAKEVVRRGWVTVYQMNQLLQGNCQLLLGPYRILDSLGKGGVCQVFKAMHVHKQSLVALKVIHPELLSNPEALGRFKREIRVVTQLDHPNIVRAFDDSQQGNTHYFAMELIEGTDLNRLVQLEGPLAIPPACDYIRQASMGMQHAHEHGLVHRDIKPGNLSLVHGGSLIKVLDLGLARLRHADLDSGPLTALGALIGTPDYISPEQARNPSAVDIRADIYSLGCTFHYLLTGSPPFNGGTPLVKVMHHCATEPPSVRGIRPEVPDQLDKIIRKMMAKDPAQRFQTPAEVADVLGPFCPPVKP